MDIKYLAQYGSSFIGLYCSVLAQGEDLVPIPGTKRREYLEENVKAVDITLTGEEITQLSNAIPPGAAAGQRYSPQAMLSVNR